MKEIRLWKNRNELSDIYIQVDDDIFEVIKNKKICAKKNNIGKYKIRCNIFFNGEWFYCVHRFIFAFDGINIKDKQIDHISRNNLDNTRDNLRIVTHQQNMWNRSTHNNSKSRHKNILEHVSKTTGKKKYIVKLYKEVCTFKSLLEAIIYANILRKKYHGEYAFIEELNKYSNEEIEKAKDNVLKIINKKIESKSFNSKYKNIFFLKTPKGKIRYKIVIIKDNKYFRTMKKNLLEAIVFANSKRKELFGEAAFQQDLSEFSKNNLLVK